LVERALKTPSLVAVRKKKLGIWKSWSWKETLKEVKLLTLGLHSLGLRKDDKLAIIGDNEPELIFLELATQACGGWPLILYPDFLSVQVAELIKRSDSSFVVAGDQEQVDKILEIWERIPQIKKVIYVDPRGMHDYNQHFLLGYDELKKLGEEYLKKYPSTFDDLIAKGKADDIAILCLTSGTTAELPKLAMLSHKNLIFAASTWIEVEKFQPTDDYFSILPLAWIGEQIEIPLSLLCGRAYNFPEKPETLMRDLREIGPTMLGGAPRMWERIASEIMFKAMDSTWLKRKFYEWALDVGKKVAKLKLEKKKPPFHFQILRYIFHWLVYRSILDKTGLAKIKVAYSGGGALGSDYFLLFRALGVNLKELYALTETTCVGCMHRNNDVKVGTTGTPLPNIEIRISKEGEILVRGENVFVGYYKNPEATAKTIVDGWLRTGDTGFIDEDGHLVVVDRIGDVLTLADGKRFSPQFIENKLKFNPYIREAVVIGKDKPYITAMLNIDYENLSKWAERNGIAFTDYSDLSQKPEVYKLLEDAVKEVNNTLPDYMHIKRFTSLPKELDADDLELTRTRKLRRKYVYEKYSQIIEGLYSDKETVKTSIAVTYRDGRQGILTQELCVRRVE